MSETGRALAPGPRLPEAAQTYLMWRRPFELLERSRERHGARFALEVRPYPSLVVLADVGEIKEMLASSSEVLDPGEGGGALAPVIGERSFTLRSDRVHAIGRKAMVNALNKDLVHRHAEMVDAVTQRVVATWPMDRPFSLLESLRALTLEVILRRTFPWRGERSEERLGQLRDLLLKMMEINASPGLIQPGYRRSLGRIGWRLFLRRRAEADELLDAVIDEQAGDPEDDESVLAISGWDTSPAARRQLRDDLMTVFLAGHETTASQLAWTFALLAHDAPARERLIAELDRGETRACLRATVEEAMRHRPVFPLMTPRAVKQPAQIGGWTYTPPVWLVGCTHLVHHDPAIYPEPQRFLPERFLEAPPPPHAWLPWGGGHKRCPGVHLATLEIEAVVRTVLSRMTLRPTAGRLERPRWRSAILTPGRGARVVLAKRSPGGVRFAREPLADSARKSASAAPFT